MSTASRGEPDAGGRSRGDWLRDKITAQGCAHATVSGTSMLPTLRPGELVRLEAPGDVRPGHIVAFEHGGGLLVHRVLTVTHDHVVCRGDNRVTPDGLTPREAIIGRAVEVFGPQRRGGERLRDDAAALRRADLLLKLRRATGMCKHMVAELALLGRQATDGVRSPAVTDAGAAPIALDLSEPCTLSSCLTAAERAARVRSWADRQPAGIGLTVRVLALTQSHRLARAGALARRGLARVGVVAGRPGDAVLPDVERVTLRSVHLFEKEELAAELSAAGLRVTHIELEDVRGVAVWRATVSRHARGSV